MQIEAGGVRRREGQLLVGCDSKDLPTGKAVVIYKKAVKFVTSIDPLASLQMR